jgi:hypothetical protein
MEYSDDPDKMADCCKRRKAGLPVDCCPPLPPDQIVRSTPEPQLVQLGGLSKPAAPAQPQPTPDTSKPQRTGVMGMVMGVVDWFKEFFTNLLKDLKAIFTGSRE